MANSVILGSLLMEAAELLNESLLDPVNSVRCQDVFDSNDKMKPELVKVIEDNFNLWLDQLNPDLKTFKVKGFKAIGSSTGYQYTDNSDLDIQVIVEMKPNHEFEETWDLIKILPNGNNAPGTNHPINYFLVDEKNPTDLNKVENLYNLDTGEWEKKQDAADLDIPVLYIREVSRIFTDSFDLLLGRYDRDAQYLKDVLKLNPETQSISESEKKEAIDKAATQIRADIDSLRLADKLIHGFRLQAYDDNNFFHISINYKDDNDPRHSMNEAIYKTLDKFEYRERIRAKIDEGYQLIENL